MYVADVYRYCRIVGISSYNNERFFHLVCPNCNDLELNNSIDIYIDLSVFLINASLSYLDFCDFFDIYLDKFHITYKGHCIYVYSSSSICDISFSVIQEDLL